MKRQMRNLTYRNLMAVIRKIEAKGWSFEEAEKMARTIFAEYRPEGLSIEERVRRVLTKEEWEKENVRGCG
jgi:hypothetical protein